MSLSAKTHQELMSELVVREHELTLKSVAEARAAVQREYAARIAALQEAIDLMATAPANHAATTDAVVSPVTDASMESVAAPLQELNFLEYAEVPVNVISKKEALTATVRSMTRVVGSNDPDDICHIVLETGGRLPYVEGQSVGVLPPGVDAEGRERQQRLYTIASSRYGDDSAGTSVSLCVRRAVYVDPATKLEDPSKKGVCSNFLCDTKPGDEVRLTGPNGKSMVLPDQDDVDLIMVATGTGAAPFRGFVKRLFVERTPAASAFRGRAWLFLGVPTTSSLIYSELWELAKSKHPDSFEATFAISREQQTPDGAECHVQHRIQEHADEVFKRLDAGAHIFFCGLKSMMPGIEATLTSCCDERGIDFKAWVKGLKKEKRWHVEVY